MHLALTRLHVAVLAALAIALGAPATASATFPGSDGRIAFAVQSDYFCGGVTDDLAAAVYAFTPGVPVKVVDFHHPLLRRAGDPDWAPSGHRIAAATYLPIRGHSGMGFDAHGVFVARADGTHRGAVTTHGYGPAWSRDARRLAYVDDLHGVRTVRLDGTHSRLLDSHQSLDVDWSSKGKIAYTRGYSSIDVIDPDGRHRHRIASGEEPDWSPNGKRIVFRETDGRIAVVRADGTHLRVIRSATDGFSPVWSPDGTQIAFDRNSASGDAVYVMAANGGGEREVATLSRDPCGDEGSIQSLDWQPRP